MRATNNQELEQAQPSFIKAHKDYLSALGFKPCESRDCTKYLEGRQRKYCGESCREKEKSRRWREKNPEKKEKSNLKYLKDIYPEEPVIKNNE